MFLIQPTNNVFTKHFTTDLATIDQPVGLPVGKLFDNHHANKANISGYLFQASNINQEIIDFIQRFKNQTKIYLYFDKFNLQLLNDASTMVKCIVKEEAFDKISNNKSKNIIKAGIMYSEQILNSISLPQERVINEDIICDISDLEKLPEQLTKVLYPHTKLKIKLFNNMNINVPQNLGFVDDMALINMIDQCRLYIDTNNNYLLYAILLDKPTLSLTNNSLLKKCKEIDQSTLDNIEKTKLELKDLIKYSYKNFINKYIL